MAPVVPFIRTLSPPNSPKGPIPGGDDVIAVKRAISRAGYYPWRRFTNSYNDEFAKDGVKAFQKKVGLPQTGIYGRATHDKLRNTRSKDKPDEFAFDAFSIKLIQNVVEKNKSMEPLEKARDILAFCRKFDSGYVYGGEHDGSFINDDPHDGFDCSSSVSYVLWKFGLLGANQAQVSDWFNTWAEAGRGKYITIHSNDDHVWMEFSLPEGYFRFDTSPHGDGPRGPRVRTSKRNDLGFVHSHRKDM